MKITATGSALVASLLMAQLRPMIEPAAQNTGAGIARDIDITSFPNSIGPRKAPGKWSLASYGFTEMTGEGLSVEVWLPDHTWSFGLTLLNSSYPYTDVCITDTAHNGGTYRSERAVRFESDGQGRLKATQDRIASPTCPDR